MSTATTGPQDTKEQFETVRVFAFRVDIVCSRSRAASKPMLSRSLVQDFFTQDPADRSCGKERCAKRFVRRERIGNFEDAGFGALAIRFRRFVFLYALVQLPRRGINLPGRNENLKFVNDGECLLNRFPRALQIAVSDGYSRLQIPSEGLQIRINGRQRGL